MCRLPISRRNESLEIVDTNEDAETRIQSRHRRHLWSMIGICGSTFSMFFFVLNVFPYSGFMALHLLGGAKEVDGDGRAMGEPKYSAANIGPYAGLLASCFRLGRIPTSIPWGRCADSYGRKFTLAAGNLAIMVGTLAFGLAPTFGSAVAIRVSIGLLCGTMVVARTAITEIAEGDVVLEAKGVAMLSAMSGYGMLIGPAIGGLLAEPVQQYPKFFESPGDEKDNENALRSMAKAILEKYPFLLPNLIGSGVAFLCLVTVLLCVEETLPDDQRRDWRLIPSDIRSWFHSRTIFRRQYQRLSTRTISDDQDGTPETQTPSPATISSNELGQLSPSTQDGSTVASKPPAQIADVESSESDIRDESNTVRESSALEGSRTNEGTTRSLFASFLIDDTSNLRYFFYCMWTYAFSSLATFETFPLFAIASTDKGGLGLTESGIGMVQTIGGLVFVFGQYPCFKFAMKRFGLLKSLRISAVIRILVLLLIPIALYILPKSNDDGDDKCHSTDSNCSTSSDNNWYLFGYLGLLNGTIGISGGIFMSCATIGFNDCIRDANKRASANGLQSMVASIGRGLGPVVAGYLVALTMSGTISTKFSAWVIYAVLMVLEGITYCSTWMVPDDESRDKNDDERQDTTDDDDSSSCDNFEDEED